jgi:hypothetical protein
MIGSFRALTVSAATTDMRRIAARQHWGRKPVGSFWRSIYKLRLSERFGFCARAAAIRVLNVNGGALEKPLHLRHGQTPAEAPHDGTLPASLYSRRCGLKSQTIDLRSRESGFIDGATITICCPIALQKREKLALTRPLRPSARIGYELRKHHARKCKTNFKRRPPYSARRLSVPLPGERRPVSAWRLPFLCRANFAGSRLLRSPPRHRDRRRPSSSPFGS